MPMMEDATMTNNLTENTERPTELNRSGYWTYERGDASYIVTLQESNGEGDDLAFDTIGICEGKAVDAVPVAKLRLPTFAEVGEAMLTMEKKHDEIADRIASLEVQKETVRKRWDDMHDLYQTGLGVSS